MFFRAYQVIILKALTTAWLLPQDCIIAWCLRSDYQKGYLLTKIEIFKKARQPKNVFISCVSTANSTIQGLCFETEVYHVDQQCCWGGNHPETPRSPDFLAKLLVIPAIYMEFKLIAHKFNLELIIYGWNYQRFSQKIWRPSGDPLETLRRPSAGGWFPPGQHCWSTRYAVELWTGTCRGCYKTSFIN